MNHNGASSCQCQRCLNQHFYLLPVAIISLTGTMSMLWLALNSEGLTDRTICWGGAVFFALMGCCPIGKECANSMVLSRPSCCLITLFNKTSSNAMSTEGQLASSDMTLTEWV